MTEIEKVLSDIIEPIIGSSVEECLALYNNVLKVAHIEGEVVEIGCLYGRTSIPICQGAFEIGKKSVHIDYLFQYPDLNTCKLGGYDAYPSPLNINDAFSKNTYLEFTRNFVRAGLFDNAIICASKSEQVREIWEKPIRFLFIDADHSHEGISKDFNAFEPFLSDGGLLALHDVDPVGHEGVFRFFKEIMATGRWQIVYNGNGTSLRILRKLSN